MPRRAAAAVSEPRSKLVAASEQEMAQRERVAALIGARMASPATTTEQELLQELRDGVENERVKFRS